MSSSEHRPINRRTKVGYRHSVAGIAISLICVALVVRGVEWADVGVQLARAKPGLLVAAAALIVALLAARAARWGVLLMALRSSAGWGRLFAALNIGYLGNNLLPARVGDLARAYLWGEWTGVSKAAALSTVAVERAVDLLSAFSCMLAVLLFVPLPEWALWSGGIAGGASLAAIVLLAVLADRRALVLRCLAGLGARVPLVSRLPLEQLVSSLLDGLAVLRDPRRGLAVAAWSVAIWAGQAIYFYVVMRSLGLEAPFVAAVTVMVFTSMSMAIPSGPGGVGVFHLAVVLGLELFGVGRDAALGAALLFHGLTFAVVSLAGLLSAWLAGVSWSRVRQPIELPGE